MPCAVYHCWLLACLQYHDDGLFGACRYVPLGHTAHWFGRQVFPGFAFWAVVDHCVGHLAEALTVQSLLTNLYYYFFNSDMIALCFNLCFHSCAMYKNFVLLFKFPCAVLSVNYHFCKALETCDIRPPSGKTVTNWL